MSTLARCSFTISLATSLLAGCGSQPPISAPGTLPQTPASAPARTAPHLDPSSASYKLLYRFHPLSSGEHPGGGLLNVNGVLYGTTSQGGSSGNGTVYRISTRGVEKVIYSFAGGSDGADPAKGLIDVNGTLYGTTKYGGSSGSGCWDGGYCGTVYSVSTSGSHKVLYSFKGGTDGGNPLAGLVAVNGAFYGTTGYGGGSGCNNNYFSGCGTVFSVTTSGQETVLYRFAGSSDGAIPDAESIDVNGVLYGTTNIGGTTSGSACPQWGGCGIVYSVTTYGKENVLYRFKGGKDGAWPSSGLTNLNGTLYGTTSGYGNNGCGDGCGTVFEIGTSGSGYSVLHGFQGEPDDGGNPSSGLVAVQGVLYGTTFSGGYSPRGCHIGYGCGTIYSITTSGAETVLHRFGGGRQGAGPPGPLANVNGTLYGVTTYGGSHDTCCYIYGYGTVFALTP